MESASKLGIWNMALARIGGAYVKQLDSAFEPSREAQMCELFYPQVLKSLLSAHPFGFARKIAPLALKPGVQTNKGLSLMPSGGVPYPEGLPLSPYAQYYAYPQEALKIWGILPGGVAGRFNHCGFMHEYEVLSNADNEKVVCCNLAQAYALYSYVEQDSSRYSPLFVEALYLALAQKLAGALSNEQRLAQALSQEARLALDAAISADANEAYRQAPASEYILAGLYDGSEYWGNNHG